MAGVCVCMRVCLYSHAGFVPQWVYVKGNTCKSQFFPSPIWVPLIVLRLLDWPLPTESSPWPTFPFYKFQLSFVSVLLC